MVFLWYLPTPLVGSSSILKKGVESICNFYHNKKKEAETGKRIVDSCPTLTSDLSFFETIERENVTHNCAVKCPVGVGNEDLWGGEGGGVSLA